MKKNFSVRKIDNLGRIVIPMDFRRALEIEEWDELRISLEESRIVVEKAIPRCTFCENTQDLTEFHGKFICPNCLKSLGIK